MVYVFTLLALTARVAGIMFPALGRSFSGLVQGQKNTMITQYIRSIASGALVGVGIALVSLAYGCGAAQDGDDTADSTELGQDQEAIKVGTGGYGFTNAATQLRCATPGLQGQVCWANGAQLSSFSYCFAPGFTAQEQDFLSQGIEQVDSQVNQDFFPTSSFPCTISIQRGAVAGGNQPFVQNYVKVMPGGDIGTLTSPAGATHVNGSWTRFSSISVVVDGAKLQANIPTLITQNMFAFGGHIAAKQLGLGTQTDTANNGTSYATRRAVMTPADFFVNAGLAPGEICRANSIVLGNLNQITTNINCNAF